MKNRQAMLRRKLVGVILAIFVTNMVFSQTITYSEPDRDDYRTLSFEIVGKINDHILVLKNNANRSNYSISVFDEDMNCLTR
jgi:hypothetical protein